jgi:hypothetical protein
MQVSIDALSDSEAFLAVKLLYDYSPPEIWEGKRKPSQERVKTVAQALLDEASGESRTVITALLAEDRPSFAPAKAELCKFILRQAALIPATSPYVERALKTATQRHMGLDPVTGAFIVAILLCTSKFKRNANGEIEFEGGAALRDAIRSVPDALRELAAVLKALPAEVLKKLGDLS